MKTLLFILASVLASPAYTQYTTINPDTVCWQSAGSEYQVPNTPSYVYTWTVTAPGILVAGQGTNAIQVDWSLAAPGLITNAITVTATNPNGCVSPPAVLDVFILHIVPTIQPVGPFCETDPCVPLIGAPAGGTWASSGLVNTDFCPTVAAPGINIISYTVTLATCTETATIQALVNPTPVIPQQPNQSVELCDEPQTITYQASGAGVGTAQWIFDSQLFNSSLIALTWSDTGTWQISQIFTVNGCVSDTMTYSVTVTRCDKLIYYIPNSFTPDGNEFNNTWQPVFTAGFDASGFTCTIYNRWGETIWESHDATEAWDGTYQGLRCAQGLYVWEIQFKHINTAEQTRIHGHINLIR